MMKAALKIVLIRPQFMRPTAIQKVEFRWHFICQSNHGIEFHFLDYENSSQELNDEDLEQLIVEGEEDQDTDEVYSS